MQGSRLKKVLPSHPRRILGQDSHYGKAPAVHSAVQRPYLFTLMEPFLKPTILHAHSGAAVLLQGVRRRRSLNILYSRIGETHDSIRTPQNKDQGILLSKQAQRSACGRAWFTRTVCTCGQARRHRRCVLGRWDSQRASCTLRASLCHPQVFASRVTLQ